MADLDQKAPRRKIRILSDGTSMGTKVCAFDTLGNACELDGVMKIQISDITPFQMVKATVTFLAVPLDVIAEEVSNG